MKKILKITLKFAIYSTIALILLGVGALGHNYIIAENEKIQGGTIRATHQESALLEIAQELRLKDIEKINFYFHTPGTGRSCDEEESGGCYFGSRRKIIIKKEALDNKELAKTLIAHEYMHDVWNVSERDKNFSYLKYLSTLMINHYAENANFRTKISWYSDNNYLVPDEMFAIACANSPDEILNGQILTECNKHLDRTKFTQK